VQQRKSYAWLPQRITALKCNPTKDMKMADEDLRAELERLRKENQA
jgi:hypothetical protein